MSADSSIIYGLDERPPLPRAVMLAIQHILTMFGSTVAVPLLFGPVLWPIAKDLPAEIATELSRLQLINTGILISSVMLCSGVATLLQSTLGSRLPIIQGVSFSFLAAFFGIVATQQAKAAPDWTAVIAGDVSASTLEPLVAQWQSTGAAAMCVIAGAVIVGGVVEALIGFSGLMGILRRYLSPVVVGPVIMLIGLALYQVGAPTAASNWPISILTMVLVVFFSLVLSKRIRLFQLFPMLSAILIGVGVCGVLSVLGIYQRGDAAYVDLSAIESSAWIRGSDMFLPWGAPVFLTSAIVAVLAGYLASIIESFGDYHVCKNMAGAGDPTPHEISRGIGMEGVACSLTGLLGGFSSTSYSENIGLVGLTKVASRFVVQVGAVMLIFLGMFGKFGACAAAIPKPVVGGLYCILFGLIAAVGVRQFAKCNLSSDRNLLIGGFALFMGLSIPFYFGRTEGGSGSLAWMNDGIRGIVMSLGSTGMAVGACIGLILDNVIPGTRDERGLEPTLNTEHVDGD
jgi:nucleobase transporter 1/2